MDFAKLVKMAGDAKARQKAFEGFDERQKAREAKFDEKAKKLAPKENFYSRSYNL